jgi:hypothetical protein
VRGSSFRTCSRSNAVRFLRTTTLLAAGEIDVRLGPDESCQAGADDDNLDGVLHECQLKCDSHPNTRPIDRL